MPENSMSNRWATIFKTGLGWMGLRGSSTGIQFLSFGHQTRQQVLELFPEAEKRQTGHLPDWVSDAIEQLQAYAAGEPRDLSTLPLDLPQGTPFQQRVRKALMQMGCGVTTTYQELAALAGSPKAARAVGNLMAKNPVPLIIPCHRVLGSGGQLGGFSAPQGLKMKQRLLDQERTASC